MSTGAQKSATVLKAGEWEWTDCGEDLEPALQLGAGWEIRCGDRVNAAYLRKMALDLMKLAGMVARHEQVAP
jgi:hypothetical protein